MKTGKTEQPELDIARLLALKAYERPDPVRTEKNIRNIMRDVRSLEREPIEQKVARTFGVFAQPRYGIAALFVIFLGLHLIDRPLVPSGSVGAPAIEAPSAGQELVASMQTNRTRAAAVPGFKPVFNPIPGETATFVSYSE